MGRAYSIIIYSRRKMYRYGNAKLLFEENLYDSRTYFCGMQLNRRCKNHRFSRVNPPFAREYHWLIEFPTPFFSIIIFAKLIALDKYLIMQIIYFHSRRAGFNTGSISINPLRPRNLRGPSQYCKKMKEKFICTADH